MDGQVRQLLYISDAQFGLTGSDIEDILAVSRRNNTKTGVTGILLYSSGVFIQALEGEPEIVGALYAKISDDRRHDNVGIISDRMIDDRRFSGWAMGFVEATPAELGTQIGIEGTLDRDEALAVLSRDQTLAHDLLRDFAEKIY